MNVEETLAFVKKMVRENKTGKVVKSVPLTAEEKKLFQEAEKRVDKIARLLFEDKGDKEKFWAMIKVRLDAFNTKYGLSISDDGTEVEFRESDDNKKQ